MIIVRDLQSTDQISNNTIKQLVEKRINDLSEEEAFDTDTLGYFVVIESGDTIEAIRAQVGFNILQNRFTGIRYDQTGFTPSFEFVEDIADCYDMVFVLSDDGFGAELFIPKGENIDADLLAMCQRYAFKTETEDAP